MRSAHHRSGSQRCDSRALNPRFAITLFRECSPGICRPSSVPHAGHGLQWLQSTHRPEYTLRDAVTKVLPALGARANVRCPSFASAPRTVEPTEVVSQLCPPPGKRAVLRASKAAAAG
jgi:hypothetical protein